MTPEDKELLIKDLCTRVPYGVKFVIDNGLNNVRTLTGIGEDIPYEDWQMCAYARGISAIPIEEIKPYLFPMSSMTEEQKTARKNTLLNMSFKALFDGLKSEEVSAYEIDFYNRHHIDYRGLIPKGLALDATGKKIY